ncbi:SRPBCC family protein [Thalassobius sp. S69A]|uniref:SRPBCC family protein n=1 Tax=unclassified Thalassovita TaxID=2619711 RepID=UPI000C0EEFD1|nr:hypothetical protein [Paracoccaceae bacterium]MBT26076.1 hypothetical protein [Paracoccaceae bacterium]
MEFTTQQDIDAPSEFVFECLSDFQSFEKAALRRGADVQRVDNLAELGLGARWDVAFSFRGKSRDVSVELVEFAPSDKAAYRASGQGIEAVMGIELVPMSRSRTRMVTTVGMEAKTLSARLLLQSMKLAKGQIGKRFDGMMGDYAKQLGKRHAKRSA